MPSPNAIESAIALDIIPRGPSLLAIPQACASGPASAEGLPNIPWKLCPIVGVAGPPKPGPAPLKVLEVSPAPYGEEGPAIPC